MAEITVNYDSELGTKVEEAFGGTIQDHLQAAVDRFMERMAAETINNIRKVKMDKYERLEKADQTKVDVLLNAAPALEEELDQTPTKLPKE